MVRRSWLLAGVVTGAVLLFALGVALSVPVETTLAYRNREGVLVRTMALCGVEFRTTYEAFRFPASLLAREGLPDDVVLKRRKEHLFGWTVGEWEIVDYPESLQRYRDHQIRAFREGLRGGGGDGRAVEPPASGQRTGEEEPIEGM